MLTSEIPVIAVVTKPLHNKDESGKRQERGLLTGCVYIIIVSSTENKPLSTTTKLLMSVRGYV